jgi:hypothetical protein
MPNAANVLKYFPTYSQKVLPSKKYMINVLNTLDPGLIIKTIQNIKKKRIKKEIEETPVIITEFY